MSEENSEKQNTDDNAKLSFTLEDNMIHIIVNTKELKYEGTIEMQNSSDAKAIASLLKAIIEGGYKNYDVRLTPEDLLLTIRYNSDIDDKVKTLNLKIPVSKQQEPKMVREEKSIVKEEDSSKIIANLQQKISRLESEFILHKVKTVESLSKLEKELDAVRKLHVKN